MILVICLLAVLGLLLELEPDMGNGGAFLFSLVLGISLVGLSVITVSSWIAASISYVWHDFLPLKRFYSYWCPLILSLPGTAFLLVYIVMSVRENYL